MKNDEMNDIAYDFDDDKDQSEKLSFILNEACHVFRHHVDGNWKEIYKPKYANMLAEHISKKPSLIKKLLKLKDSVVSNVTYAAIEITKNS
ncbi:hypothetical protein NBRC116493_03770 [Aurantivibrio infirmus]